MVREYGTVDYVYVVTEAVVGALAIVCNSFLLGALCRYRRLRTLTTYIVSSLGIAGVLAGVLLPILTALLRAGLPTTFYWCVLVVCLVNAVPNLTTLSLLCVVIDRYCHLFYAVNYLRWATFPRIVGAVSAAWILGMLIGLVPFVWHKDPEGFQVCSSNRVEDIREEVYVLFLGFLLPVLVLLSVLYIRVFVAFRKSNIRYQRKNMMLRPLSGASNTTIHMKETILFKRLALIFVLLVVTTLPLHILTVVRLWMPSAVTEPSITLFLLALSHVSAFTNPLVYLGNRREFELIVASVFPLHHIGTSTPPERVIRVGAPRPKSVSRQRLHQPAGLPRQPPRVRAGRGQRVPAASHWDKHPSRARHQGRSSPAEERNFRPRSVLIGRPEGQENVECICRDQFPHKKDLSECRSSCANMTGACTSSPSRTG